MYSCICVYVCMLTRLCMLPKNPPSAANSRQNYQSEEIPSSRVFQPWWNNHAQHPSLSVNLPSPNAPLFPLRGSYALLLGGGGSVISQAKNNRTYFTWRRAVSQINAPYENQATTFEAIRPLRRRERGKDMLMRGEKGKPILRVNTAWEKRFCLQRALLYWLMSSISSETIRSYWSMRKTGFHCLFT